MSSNIRQRILRWLRAAASPALLFTGLIAAGIALRELGLDDGIAAMGQSGPAAFLVGSAIACAVGIPRQMVAYSGGLAFGFWLGSALALVAEGIGCAATLFWARMVARKWAAHWLSRSGNGRVDRLHRFLVANAFTATLTLRLLPVGNNLLLNLLAGVSGVAAGPFIVASMLGYVPQTAVFALLGGGVRVSEGAQVGLAVALFAGSVLLGLLLLRRRAVS